MTSQALIRILPLALALVTTPVAAATLADLSWMTGTWTGTVGEVTSDETWTATDGTLMLGVHRDRKASRTFSFEFLRIEQKGDTLTYIALPRGRNETRFPLTAIQGKRAVFENPAHDFPQRIIYWQAKPGTLSARTEGRLNGKLESEEWTWTRAKEAR